VYFSAYVHVVLVVCFEKICSGTHIVQQQSIKLQTDLMPIESAVREMLGQIFPRWPGDASEPALPRAPKHKPRPAAAAELALA
jgi:hypothetical protein